MKRAQMLTKNIGKVLKDLNQAKKKNQSRQNICEG